MKRPRQDSNIISFTKYICVAVLFMGAAILFFSCENDIEKIKAFNSPDNLPSVEIIDFETMSTDSGKISYTLKAPRVKSFETDGKKFTEFPEGMELKKFDSNGNIVSSIRADYAKQNELEDKWEASNNVVATNLNGDTLKTENLIWERRNGSIYTEEFVKIISSDKIMYGDGLTSDEQMQSWEIKNPKGIIYITMDDDQPQENNPEIEIQETKPIKLKEKPNSGELQLEK